jgi:predicted DNA-binding protein
MAGEGRIHLRLPPELKEWLKGHASRRGMTLSALVVLIIQEMRGREKALEAPTDAEQI